MKRALKLITKISRVHGLRKPTPYAHLSLECGHKVMFYRVTQSKRKPKRVHCEECAKEAS